MTFYGEVMLQRLVRTIELNVMEKLVHHLLSLSVLALDRQRPGDILETVRQDVQKLRLSLLAIANLLLRVLTAGALIAAAAWVSPSLAAIAFPVLVLAGVPHSPDRSARPSARS